MTPHTQSHAGTSTSELQQLMSKVENLRRLSQTRPREIPDALAAGGRPLAPGLYGAEYRFPRWYLERRHCATASRAGVSAPLPLTPAAASPTLITVQAACLDDGSPRLFTACLARLDDGELMIRQAWTTAPGAEAALLAWLGSKLPPGSPILATDAQSRALLLEAGLRHGQPPASAVQRLASHRRHVPARLLWRSLDRQSAQRALDSQRQALLELSASLGFLAEAA